MIQLALVTDKGPIGIVGINEENLLRMKAGMPLNIDIKQMTPPGTRINRVIIHYAHTYEETLDDMVKGGLPVTDEIRKQVRELDEQVKKGKRQDD